MGDEKESLLGYGRTMRRVSDAAKAVWSCLQRHPLTVDTAIACTLALAALVSLNATYGALPPNDPSYSHGFTVAVVVSMLALTLPLALRRRFPFSVGLVVVAGFPGCPGRCPRTRGQHHVAGAVVDVLQRRCVLAIGDFGPRSLPCATSPSLPNSLTNCSSLGHRKHSLSYEALTFLYNVVVLSLPWMLGAAIWSLRDRQRTLAAQAVELQREREENARQAVFAERVRIARELHDVVAHHVSVMGVQAAGARRVMDRDPQRAAEALSSIEHSSRRAVSELHRLLGFPSPRRRLRRAVTPAEPCSTGRSGRRCPRGGPHRAPHDQW